MKITPKIEWAICRSAELHKNQVRRHSDIPYVAHPFAIAFHLQNYTDNEDIIVAALLHDVLEDVRGYEYPDLAKEFGKKVADIVQDVSEEKSPYSTDKKDVETWKYRKERYIENLKRASREALFVSAGDKFHNLHSLLEIHKVHGDPMWKMFHAPQPKAETSLWFYEGVLSVLKKRLDSPIVKDVEKNYKEAVNAFLH